MATLRTITTVGFGPVVTPDGAALVGAVVTFTLSGSTGKPLASVDVNSDETVVKIVTATTDASGDFSVSLIPNDHIAGDTYYRVDIADADFEPVVNKLATGIGSVAFADFISTGASPSDVSVFTAHIQDNIIHQPPSVGAFVNLKAQTNETNPNHQVDVTADNITLSDADGLPFQAVAVAVTTDITASGANGLDTGSEKSGEHYALYLIHDPLTPATAGLLKLWTLTGSATSTTTSKLVDAGSTFSTDLVSVGDKVINQTTSAETTVTVIDSETELSLSADIFTSGDAYRVVLGRDPTMPTGYTLKRRVGSVFNDSSGNFRPFRQAARSVFLMVEEQFLFLGAATTFTAVTPEVPPSASCIGFAARAQTATFPGFLSYDAASISVRFVTNQVANISGVSLNNFGQVYYRRSSGVGTIDFFLNDHDDNI